MEDSEELPMQLAVTLQHCWRELFTQSLTESEAEGTFRVNYLSRVQDLPSCSDLSTRLRPQYALFRAEEVEPRTGKFKRGVHASNTSFELLDPKDALYRLLSEVNAAHLMPPTMLLSYDCFASPAEDGVGASGTGNSELVLEPRAESKELLRAIAAFIHRHEGRVLPLVAAPAEVQGL